MYTKILSRRYRKTVKAVSLMVLLAFIFSLNACMTYYTENLTPAQFRNLEEPEKEILLKLTTKDSVINAEKYPIAYAKAQATFIVEKTDSLITVSTNPLVFKKVKTLSKIGLNDVISITTEKSEFDTGKMLKWTGIVAGSLLVIGIILLIIFPPSVNMSGTF